MVKQLVPLNPLLYQVNQTKWPLLM